MPHLGRFLCPLAKASGNMLCMGASEEKDPRQGSWLDLGETEEQRIAHNRSNTIFYRAQTFMATVGLVSLLTTSTLDNNQLLALGCLAATWPIMGSVAMVQGVMPETRRYLSQPLAWLGSLATLGQCVGITALFAHFGWRYAIAFGVGLIFAVWILFTAMVKPLGLDALDSDQ